MEIVNRQRIATKGLDRAAEYKFIVTGSSKAAEQLQIMLKLQSFPTDVEAADIVKKFVNDRLIGLMEDFPIEKANREFFGLYGLLKAKKEYVPMGDGGIDHMIVSKRVFVKKLYLLYP